MHVRLPKLSGRFVVVTISLILVLLTGAGFGVYYFSRSRIQIPTSITKMTAFPIYIPKSLPDDYAVDVHSFKNVTGEDKGVLVFQVNNTVGDSLVFSEQRKPANVNFDEFSAQQMTTPKKLPNVPYPTTAGKTLDKQTTLLSIVTDTTWIIVATQTELTNQQMHDIAAGISKY